MKSNMSLKSIGRDRVVFFDDEKSITIYGEWLVDNDEGIDFVAATGGDIRWDPPNDNLVITEKNKRDILNKFAEEMWKQWDAKVEF